MTIMLITHACHIKVLHVIVREQSIQNSLFYSHLVSTRIICKK